MTQTLPQQHFSAVWNRLSLLAELTPHDRLRIEEAESGRSVIRSHRDIIREGEPVRSAQMLLAGWAFRSHLVPNGQRQILGMILPGELIGASVRRRPLAVSTITTMTQTVVCAAPQAEPDDPRSGLAEAYAVSAAVEEAHLCRQITRLGRMSSYERLVDWLLELHDRLLQAAIAKPDGFVFPLTQELIADALGLTSVHVNRTIRALRESGMATVGARSVTIHDRKQMERLVCYRPVKVVA